MPYIGLIPFLRKEENEENFKGTCVNALHRAYPISTPKMTAMWFMFFTVSMPYIGLIPFLQYPLKNLIKSMVSGTVFRG